MSVDTTQPHPHPLRSNPSLQFATPPLPPLPAKCPLRLQTGKPLPALDPLEEAIPQHHPDALRSNPPNQFTRPPSLLLTSAPSPTYIEPPSDSRESWLDNTDDLVIARLTLLEQCSDDIRCAHIQNRMDESSGKLLPALPTSPAIEQGMLDKVHYLRSLSRNEKLARVGDPERNIYLSRSEPAKILRKKLKRGVIEKRGLTRRQRTSKSRSRRAMNTLRALMLNGDKQAETEYFHQREAEEQEREQARKESED